MLSWRTKQKTHPSTSNTSDCRSMVALPIPLSEQDSNGRCEFVSSKMEQEAEKDPAECQPLDKAGSEQIALWLSRADQLFLGSLLIALLVLLIVVRWKLSGGGRTEIEIVSQQPREYYYAIDINRASWVEWAQLDGIGEKLARRIIDDRDKRGPFGSIDDVARVCGIGPKMLEKLRPFLTFAADERVKRRSDSIKD